MSHRMLRSQAAALSAVLTAFLDGRGTPRRHRRRLVPGRNGFLGAQAVLSFSGFRPRPHWPRQGLREVGNRLAGGSEFILVDAPRGVRGPAFDHVRVAAALSAAGSGKPHAGDEPAA